ncbi:hypothetical protein D3C71_1780490 [compost metagenome]
MPGTSSPPRNPIIFSGLALGRLEVVVSAAAAPARKEASFTRYHMAYTLSGTSSKSVSKSMNFFSGCSAAMAWKISDAVELPEIMRSQSCSTTSR